MSAVRAVPSASATLDAVTAMAPELASRAAEIEQARRLPSDILDRLVAAGCFRLLLPQSHGGAEAAGADVLPVLEALSRADTSVGWTVMIGSGSWIDLAGLPRATFDEIFRPDADVITAGAFAPGGSATAVDGGYQVTGRWGFLSGCEHATCLFGNCIEMTDDGPRMRMAVFSPEQVRIEDTWNVSGLRGTGSHHVSADNVVVPAELSFPTLEHEPCVDTVAVHVPPPALIGLAIASVALGTARGALDDIVALAEGKVPLLAGSALAGNPHFQYELARADTELRAARALVYELAEELWATAGNGGEWTLSHEARIRAAAAWAADRAAAVVETAYRQGGGSALYDDSPLQRRLRDVHAITQHFIVKPDTLTAAGAVMAGQDSGVPVF